METARAKAESMKPGLLKAGIPLALSVAGFICARIISRRTLIPTASSSEPEENSSEANAVEPFSDDEESFHSLCSASSAFQEEEEQMVSRTLWGIQDNLAVQDEILGLRSQIEDLQGRERKLEMRFLWYCDLKEQEATLVELLNLMNLEMAHIDFLGREVSSMEDQNGVLGDMVVEFLRVADQNEFSRTENGLLQRKVKKLSRKMKKQSRVIGERNLNIKAIETEFLRTREELEMKTAMIKASEDEVQKLQGIIHQLQAEKSELLNRPALAENLASSVSEIDAEGIAMEDYNQLRRELEQIRQDRAAEVKELISLRWSNACLRHELTRNHEQPELNREKKSHLELAYFEGDRQIEDCNIDRGSDGSRMERGGSRTGSASSRHVRSTRPRLLRKLRAWADGCEKTKEKRGDHEKGKHEIKCFGRHSFESDEADEHHDFCGRRSCSSA